MVVLEWKLWWIVGIFIQTDFPLATCSKVPAYHSSNMLFMNRIPGKGSSDSYPSVKGLQVQVVIQDIFPYITKASNATPISGFLGDMWLIFEETLLFKSTVRTTRYEEGRDMIKNYSADVFLTALVYTNQTTNMEFSQPYFRNWYHLYFKLPEGKPATYLHFVAFSGTLWLQLALFFAFLTITLYLSCVLLSKTSPELEALLSLPTYFLGVVSAFVNTGFDLKLRSWSARFQILLALFFGVLCYYALSASLVASLAVLDRPLPFLDIADIAQKPSYSLCIRNVTFVYDNFTSEEHTLLPAWKGIVNTNRCPRDMQKWKTIPESICKGKVVVLENRIIMAWALHGAQCPITILPQRYFNKMNFIGFSKRFEGRKVISMMMLKMRSTGITKKLESKWVKNNELPELARTTEVNQITFAHVKGLILIHLIMIGISLILLLMEILVFKMSPRWKKWKEQWEEMPNAAENTKTFTVREQVWFYK